VEIIILDKLIYNLITSENILVINKNLCLYINTENIMIIIYLLICALLIKLNS
jgi:hypothetical protein